MRPIKRKNWKEKKWYWCLHCERTFRAKRDPIYCHYHDCDGFMWDLSPWEKDHWPRRENPDYPETPTRGVTYPLYPRHQEMDDEEENDEPEPRPPHSPLDPIPKSSPA